MTLSELLDANVLDNGRLNAVVDDVWTQGRTSYGGLSTALCYHAAAQALPEPRALRSAMISFVGPSAGPVDVEAELMRAGRTAASVRTRLKTPDTNGVEASFIFSNMRESVLNVPGPGLPEDLPPHPETGPELVAPPELAPAFTRQFDWIWPPGLAPFVHTGSPEERVWVRLKDERQWETMAGLLCVGDALPPAVAPIMTQFAPISSMTWMVDVLTDELKTDDGWWLLESKANYAGGGHCSQDMTIWNTRGECVVKGRQMVTVFL